MRASRVVTWFMFVVVVDVLIVERTRCALLLLKFEGSRTSNFIVGLTNTAPASVQPTITYSPIRQYNYVVCNQWPGNTTDGGQYFLPCAATIIPYRYVVIQLPTYPNTQFLNFCELEVYTQRKSTKTVWCRIYRLYVRVKLTITVL
jgi:hypothetical protein